MPNLVELHRSYLPSSGLFSVKRDCEEVASRIRAALDSRFVNFNPMTVVVAGKRNQHWIEFPRIGMHWQPTRARSVEIAEELAQVATLFAEIYQPKEKSRD